MTADVNVTAKLAQWAALTEGATPGPWEWIDGPRRELGSALRGVLRCGTLAHPDPGGAEFIAAAREMVPVLLAAVKDVRALHVSSSESRGVGRVDPETGEWGAYCDHDSEWWPCPTVQALTKWIGGEG